MALRDQPYLPLYVGDFLSDEKLSLCSAESTGVYIRLMCLMHKSAEYGVISLSRLDRKSGDPIQDFTLLFAKQMPFENDVIYRGISELFEREVISISGNKLSQKRMVRDAEISKKRAAAGSKGGSKKASKYRSKTVANDVANDVANTEIENENEYEYEYIPKDIGEDKDNEETVSAREDLSRVFRHYETAIGSLPSANAIEMMKAYAEEMGADVVCRAIDIALDANAGNWHYIETVLQNWTKQKVKSLDDVLRIEAERKLRKEATSGRTQGTAGNGGKERDLPGIIEL